MTLTHFYLVLTLIALANLALGLWYSAYVWKTLEKRWYARLQACPVITYDHELCYVLKRDAYWQFFKETWLQARGQGLPKR